MKASRIVLASVGCVAISGFLILIGSGKESRAQTKPVIAIAPAPADEPLALPPAGPPSDPPAEGLPVPSPEPAPLVLRPAVAQPPAAATNENDPEQVAREFVEKNQKIAETELATLKKEAEALQNRLQKVEAAIRRWEVVAHALKQSDGAVSKIDGSWKAEPSFNRVRMPNIDEPSELEPIEPKTSVDGPPRAVAPRR